jgi:hypothetical protein
MLKNNENDLHKQSSLQDSHKNKVKPFFFYIIRNFKQAKNGTNRR